MGEVVPSREQGNHGVARAPVSPGHKSSPYRNWQKSIHGVARAPVSPEHAWNSVIAERPFDLPYTLKGVRERGEHLAGQARRGARAREEDRRSPVSPPLPRAGALAAGARGRPLQEIYIDAVRGSGMEKKHDNILMDGWGPQAETGKTDAEVKAARERWMSLSGEERRRLMIEYDEERCRQERFGEIP